MTDSKGNELVWTPRAAPRWVHVNFQVSPGKSLLSAPHPQAHTDCLVQWRLIRNQVSLSFKSPLKDSLPNSRRNSLIQLEAAEARVPRRRGRRRHAGNPGQGAAGTHAHHARKFSGALQQSKLLASAKRCNGKTWAKRSWGK